jgi:hypothetical protein
MIHTQCLTLGALALGLFAGCDSSAGGPPAVSKNFPPPTTVTDPGAPKAAPKAPAPGTKQNDSTSLSL